MRKCAITVVALLATAGASLGGMASFSFGPTELLSGTVVDIPVWATGDAEADAMTLAVEVQAPLEILGITATDPGFYFYPCNDEGGLSRLYGPRMATFDVLNPSLTIHLPPLSATPSLMAMVRVCAPVGTPFGMYSISTVISAFENYPSGLAYDGVLLDVTQAQMLMPLDIPEPATVLLLLGVLPLMRRQRVQA